MTVRREGEKEINIKLTLYEIEDIIECIIVSDCEFNEDHSELIEKLRGSLGNDG